MVGFDADASADALSDDVSDTDLEIEGETFIEQCACVIVQNFLVSHYFSQLT